jgi:sarcosine dehydrogenase
VLVEKDLLTAGTTWHSAGMLWNLRPDDSGQEISSYTRKMCAQLEEETGISSWTSNGGLWIACNEERLKEYMRMAETGKYFGTDAQVVSPDEAVEIHPLLSTTDVYGALYIPSDGTIDPTSFVNAYAKAAQTRGARIFENTLVTNIESVHEISVGGRDVRRVTAVEVNGSHKIKTKVVVNACGAWAEKISGMVGAEIPLRAMKHAMVMTETLPGMHAGCPNVRDHDLSIYLKTQGDAICLGGYEQNPEFCDPDTLGSFHLFNLDWDTFNQNLEGHLKRCPIVETKGIKSEICGPESFTPDHKPLVGPHPGTRGFYQACGMNSMGIVHT